MTSRRCSRPEPRESLDRRPKAEVGRLDREDSLTHHCKLAATVNEANSSLGGLRGAAARPAARERPAQALHRPAAECEQQETGDEQQEEESLLHASEARCHPARRHRRAG